MQAVVAVDMTEALRFISEAQERHNVKLTPTLLVGRALAEAMKVRPSIHCSYITLRNFGSTVSFCGSGC